MQFQLLQKSFAQLMQGEESLPFICYDLANCLIFWVTLSSCAKWKQRKRKQPFYFLRAACYQDPIDLAYSSLLLTEESIYLHHTKTQFLHFPVELSLEMADYPISFKYSISTRHCCKFHLDAKIHRIVSDQAQHLCDLQYSMTHVSKTTQTLNWNFNYSEQRNTWHSLSCRGMEGSQHEPSL